MEENGIQNIGLPGQPPRPPLPRPLPCAGALPPPPRTRGTRGGAAGGGGERRRRRTLRRHGGGGTGTAGGGGRSRNPSKGSSCRSFCFSSLQHLSLYKRVRSTWALPND